MVISAKRGEKDKGYVALDDFLFEKTAAESCNIYPTSAEPTKPPPTFPDCDFEEDFCGAWHTDDQLNGTELFVFIRTSGSLHQDGDGPDHDHSMNPNSKT